MNTIRCSCSSLISKLNENSEAGTSFSESRLFPKTFCQIANNYLIGANSELIYLIDENLKYVKSMCLIETLEMKQEAEQKRHTTLINKVDLRLDTVSICYDIANNNVGGEATTTTTTGASNTNANPTTTGGFSRQTRFRLLLKNKFFVSHLSTEFLNKKILCNQNYLFICERNNIVRVFSKEAGRYLFSIKNHDQQKSEIKVELKSSEVSYDELSQNKGKVKDICVDVNGNLYVAYNFNINVFNESCEFLWKYDFRKELVNFRIVQISILKTNSIGLLVEDEKNNYSNKLYIFE